MLLSFPPELSLPLTCSSLGIEVQKVVRSWINIASLLMKVKSQGFGMREPGDHILAVVRKLVKWHVSFNL